MSDSSGAVVVEVGSAAASGVYEKVFRAPVAASKDTEPALRRLPAGLRVHTSISKVAVSGNRSTCTAFAPLSDSATPVSIFLPFASFWVTSILRKSAHSVTAPEAGSHWASQSSFWPCSPPSGMQPSGRLPCSSGMHSSAALRWREVSSLPPHAARVTRSVAARARRASWWERMTIRA